MGDEQPELLLERDGAVLSLRLNRPDKLNALTAAMFDGLSEALSAAQEDDGVRAIMFSGEGSSYTAGRDIGEFATANSAGVVDISKAPPARAIQALMRLSKPVVASVRGQAVGFGMTMLLHCDLVVAAPDAVLSAPFVSLGLSPEAGSSLLLSRLVGHQRAFALFALGKRLSGEEASSWGLVHELQPADQCDAVALALAHRLAELPPEAMRQTKGLMRRSQELLAVQEEESRVFGRLLAGDEAAQAFRAFRQRPKTEHPAVRS